MKTLLPTSIAVLIILLSLYAQLRTPGTAPSDYPSLSTRWTQDEKLADNEIIWAGLSGNPPRFIDAGEDKGLGYLEIQTKLIRKALAEAGFKIRYEYFSSARIAHEFSRKSPICFYPTEWMEPEKVFEKTPDRIYSIPLDFKGEEIPSIIIFKEDEQKFQKYINSKGILSIKDLLKDSSLKTLLPKTEGLGPEFSGVFRSNSDGSIEITAPYSRHISTRVVRDNHQLIQMLNGRRFDYLLDTFVIKDDYKSIRSGKLPFKSIPYAAETIKSISDPQVKLVSVSCGIHPTTLRALPQINHTISTLRSSEWSIKNQHFQSLFEPPGFYFVPMFYRFAVEIAAGKADAWYPMQVRHFPSLKLLSTSQALSEGSDPKVRLQRAPAQRPQASWLVVPVKKNALWLLPKSDAILLSTAVKPRCDPATLWYGPVHREDQVNAWTPEQLQALKAELQLARPGKNFDDAIKELLMNTERLKSFSLLARTLTPAQFRQLAPILKKAKLNSLDLVSANADTMKEMLNELPSSIEKLNLWGSHLGLTPLAPVLNRFTKLKELNLGFASIEATDFEESLLALKPELVSLQAAHQPYWTEGLAKKFGAKALPRLELLDLEFNGLDDRYCDLFEAVPPSLKALRLNGNLLTSDCFRRLFSKHLNSLRTLEVSMIQISTRKGAQFEIPRSVQELDLSHSLDQDSLEHVNLPPKLTSVWLASSSFGKNSFSQIAEHLSPQLDALDLTSSNSPEDAPLGLTLFNDLASSGIKSIHDLRLPSINLADAPKNQLSSFKVENVNLRNTRLSNSLLAEISASWGASLKSISLGQNLLSSQGLVNLLKRSPNLEKIDFSDLVELEIPSVASSFPHSLKSLNLANNGLTDHDLEALLPKLPEALSFLDLSGSFFGPRGAEVLAEYLDRGRPELGLLNLNTPLQEASWELILNRLPPDLSYLKFGPASLGSKATASFLDHIPEALTSLRMDSVELTLPALEGLIQKLPRGLWHFIFTGASKLSGLNPFGPPSQGLQWPASTRIAYFFSSLEPGILGRLLESKFPSNVRVLMTPKVTGKMLAPLFEQLSTPNYFNIHNATLDRETLEMLNRSQPAALTLENLSLDGALLAQISPTSLRRLKMLNLNGAASSANDFFALLKQLPPHMYSLQLDYTPFEYKDVPGLIAALPTGLQEVSLVGSRIGPEGAKQLFSFANQLRKKTGFKLKVRTSRTKRD